MQPNTYYQVTPINNEKQKNTKPIFFVVVVIAILAIIIIALGIALFIALKNKGSNPDNPDVAIANIDLSTPLSSVDQNDYAAALVGRSFVTNTYLDEYIKFKSNNEYSYSYYRDAESDPEKTIPSARNGNFTIEGNLIKLDQGDSFTITKDYLVKTDDNLSNNQATVYFDLQQLSTFISRFSNAITSYIKTSSSDDEPRPDDEDTDSNKNSTEIRLLKTRIVKFSCRAGDYRPTKADDFVCTTSYDVYSSDAPDNSSTIEGFQRAFILRINDAKYEITGIL